jgi:hypothetical protein
MVGPDMRAGATIVVLTVLCAARGVRAESESAWIAGSFGMGGGMERFGPLHFSADLEATYWFRERIGAGLVWRGYGAGEPDGRTANGSFYLATATIRHDWMSSHHGQEFPARVYLTVGVGAGHHDGFDEYDEMRPFDRWGFASSVAVGVLAAPGWGLLGMQVALHGIGNGFAVVPMYVMGFKL